jgi:hypothetical protein
MSVATEFPPDVFIPAAARPRSLRAVPADPADSTVPGRSLARPHNLTGPVAPAAAALGAEVLDLDRWRHQFVGTQAGGRRRTAAGLRARPNLTVGTALLPAPQSAPVRLTRRGVVTLAIGSTLAGLAIVATAWLSASSTSTAADSAGSADGASSVVTVRPGDSLWTIATQVAPTRDPRAEVAELSKLNHLSGITVTPGQQLRVR